MRVIWACSKICRAKWGRSSVFTHATKSQTQAYPAYCPRTLTNINTFAGRSISSQSSAEQIRKCSRITLQRLRFEARSTDSHIRFDLAPHARQRAAQDFRKHAIERNLREKFKQSYSKSAPSSFWQITFALPRSLNKALFLPQSFLYLRAATVKNEQCKCATAVAQRAFLHQ